MSEKYSFTMDSDQHGPGWFITGPGGKIRIGKEGDTKQWADIICRYLNGHYNQAKGLMVEMEKRRHGKNGGDDRK